MPAPRGTFSAAAEVQRLEQALAALDRDAARSACDELVRLVRDSDDLLDQGEVSRALGAVRRARRPELLQQLAEALLEAGSPVAAVARPYAQALVDQGVHEAARAVVHGLLLSGAAAEDEVLEARGLLGRVAKQRFLSCGPDAPARRAALLAEAVGHYRAGYEAAPSQLWQGGNLAALLARAARDGVPLPDDPQPSESAERTARAVLEAVEALPQRTAWDCATALEAELALGHGDAALPWLRRFLDDGTLGAFEVGSLLRQLTEVWQLEPEHGLGALVLPPLQAVLLRKEGADLDVGSADVTAAQGREPLRRDAFEAVFGPDGVEAQRWFEELLERCRGVVRVEDAYGEGVGSGFLVVGPDLSPSFPPHVLLTNAHVVPDGVPVEDAVVAFRGLPQPRQTRVRRLLWSSPVSGLDATVLELDEVPPGASASPLARQLPALDAAVPARVYVLGHPLGALSVKVSIRDNALLDYDDDWLHYLAATEPGSSGGPVFDRRWQLVGLHHAGSERMPRLHGPGSYQANEGVRLDRIRRALARQQPERP